MVGISCEGNLFVLCFFFSICRFCHLLAQVFCPLERFLCSLSCELQLRTIVGILGFGMISIFAFPKIS